MVLVLLLIFGFLFICFPVFRCFIFNIHKYLINKSVDLYNYIRYKEYNEPPFYGMDIMAGCSHSPMGSGKTLASVNTIVSIKKRYDGKIQIDKKTKKQTQNKIIVLSNVDLKEIEYTRFKGFEQVTQFVELKNKLEVENPEYKYYLYVLLDEASIFLNSSKWKDKDNPITCESLNDLCQIRHNCIQMLLFTSQRFEMCNVNIRRLSSFVKTCELVDLPFLKRRRFLVLRHYISRDLEECTSELMIKPVKLEVVYIGNENSKGWKYGTYDTHEMAGKIMQKISENDYLSEEDFNKSVEKLDHTGINHLRTNRKYRKHANK